MTQQRIYSLLLLPALLATALICVGFASYGQSQDAKSWQRIQGDAVDIAVGADGTVAAVGKKGDVYLFNHAEESWQPIGKSMSRIAKGQNGALWGVDINGVVRQYTGASWVAIGGGATDISVGDNGVVYVVTNTGSLARYAPATSEWKAIDGNAARIAIDAEGLPWGISSSGVIARRLDDAWIGVVGKAADISADSSGRMVMVGRDGKLYEWLAKQASWAEIAAVPQVVSVAIGDGQTWLINRDGKIFAQGITDKHRNKDAGIYTSEGNGRGGSLRPEEQPDLSEIVFERVPDNSRFDDLSIGRDGSIYGLEADQTLKRWSNMEQRFYDFPGVLNRLAVRSNGTPVGIGTNGNLVQHDGEAWRLVVLNLLMRDLSLAQDDNLQAISLSKQAAQLSPNFQTYALLPKQGVQIANHPRGGYWVIDDAMRLYQCPDGGMPCEQQAIQATDVAIGPGGSVFVVDNSATLRRYNTATKEFDIIRQGDTTKVALGPKDRPWILDNQGLVWQAGYFERDETFDRRVAIRTKVTENITEVDPPFITANPNNTRPDDEVTEEPENPTDIPDGVQIVQNVPFTAVTVPTSAPGIGEVGAGLTDVTSGINNEVIVTGFSQPCVSGTGRNWIYDPTARKFNFMTYLNRVNLLTGIAGRTPPVTDIQGDDPPGTVQPDISAFYGNWARYCTEVDLLTYVADVFNDSASVSANNYDDAAFFSPQVLGTQSDIDIAKDDTVVWVSTKRHMEYFTPSNVDGAKERYDLQFLRIAVGANLQQLWAVDTAYNVYQLDPSTDKFLLRSTEAADKAQDVGVGHDGTVFIVTTAGVLKKWDAISQIFVKTNKTGVTRVAVDSRGKPIVANFPSSQIVYFGK